MKRRGWISVALSVFLAGCRAVGPDYQTPETNVSQTPLPQMNAGTVISPDEVSAWWMVFNDPALTNLIVRTLQGNHTLREGRARVREARARLGISRSGLLPEVDVAGSYQRFRNSDYVVAGSDGDFYHAGFDASWELDIFGRRRREIEVSQAAFEAEVASLEQVWVSLAAETARHYVNLQTVRQQLAVASSNLVIQADTWDLVRSRAKAGLSDALAVEQATYNLEQTRAKLPQLHSQEEASLHALAVLTGVMPGDLNKALCKIAPIPSVSPRMLAGIPADLLRRRPDVLVAERQLAAQTARIGVAQADQYPTFLLSGSVGLESLDESTFLESGSRFFSLAPSVVWPIFRAGSIRANIEVQNALQEQALAVYEEVVLEAVRELRDALADYGHEYVRCEALRKAAKAAREAVSLSQNQYKNGLSDFNNVLDAQRSLMMFEELVVISEGAITDHLIRVYKAMGGGWSALSASVEEKKEEKVAPLLLDMAN